MEAFFAVYTQRNLIIQYLHRWLKKDILKICSHGYEENNAIQIIEEIQLLFLALVSYVFEKQKDNFIHIV